MSKSEETAPPLFNSEDGDGVDDSVSHTNHDSGPLGGANEDKKVKLELAKKEDGWVFYLRLLTALVLLAVAVSVCLAVYFEGKASEKDDFESDFADLGEKLVTSFETAVKTRLAILNNFAMSLTSYVEHTPNVSWPFVTPPDYEERGAGAAQLAQLFGINFVPKVPGHMLRQWNMYAQANKGWREEGWANAMGGTVRPEDVNLRPIAPVLMNFTTRPPKPVPPNQSLYFAMWCQAPAVNNSLANNDLYAIPGYKPQLDAVMEAQRPVFRQADDFWDVPDEIKNQNPAYEVYKSRGLGYLDDPFTTIIVPIMNTLKHNSQKQVVATLVAGIYWRTYFNGLLPPGANGIDIVLHSDCQALDFTYRVNGVESLPVGKGDLHDNKYDYLAVHSDVNQVLQLAALPEHLQDASCSYSISAYPSEDFEDSYRTDKPWVYAVVLACLFLFTSAVFLLYDYMVEQRQKIVMKSAQQSGQLVQSLYPKAALDKMYQEQEEITLQSDAKSGFRNNGQRSEDTSIAGYSPKEAIANLYPETTIFFADLAGFTKWSSKRTPVEVFQLLEALYGEFDKIAKRRRVFKVETIGDCYVAATGIPEPQEDHAVTICKFASDCMNRMNTMTAELKDSMGEDTAELAMRVGLHTGPVTAGVLRGEKARFQLFGDTVNTASRMESNGIKGRIQVSQSTADALVARGKGVWLTPREDKIEAKGKGLMQTYFVEVSSKAKSSLSRVSSMSATSEPSDRGYSSSHRDPIKELLSVQQPQLADADADSCTREHQKAGMEPLDYVDV